MDANVNRRVLLGLGIQHVWIGVTLPILCGFNWFSEMPNFIAASPVWGGILFFIPTGILGILAIRVQSRRLINASLMMSVFSGVVAFLLITIWSITAAYNEANLALDIIIALLGVLELIMAKMSGRYSMRVLSAPAVPDSEVAVTYKEQAVIFTIGQVQQYPEAYPGQPQDQHPGQP